MISTDSELQHRLREPDIEDFDLKCLKNRLSFCQNKF